MAVDLVARGLALRAGTDEGGGEGGGGGGAAVVISDYYEPEHGDDLRIATQAAIDAATASSLTKRVMNDYGPITMQMFDQDVAGSANVPFYLDRRMLTVPDGPGLDLDFAGARIELKGPGGGDRYPGQTIPDAGLGNKYYGGFLCLDFDADMGFLRLANVEVDGGFDGTIIGGASTSLYDKGIRLQGGAALDRFTTDDIKLSGFLGEVMYDNISRLHVSRNSTYEYSPTSCWNPNGTGRVVAYNLEAGHSFQVAEVVGGLGHVYHGGRFYDSSSNTFIGGPDSEPPGFSGAAYNSAVRQNDRSPPYIQFIGTRFEACNNIYLGCWAIGTIYCVDTRVIIQSGYAVDFNVHDTDLEIFSTVDRFGNSFPAVIIYGPTTADGTEMTNTSLRVRSGKTNLAGGAGNSSIGAALEINGVIGAGCHFSVEGTGGNGWTWTAPASGHLPRINDEMFYGSNPPYVAFTADFTHTVASNRVKLYNDAASAGTYNVSVDLTRTYSEGQKFRFTYDSNGPSPKIVSFAATGAGMILPATRELNSYGHFLELTYREFLGKWVESGFAGV